MGSLMYAMICTMLDIAQVVGLVSRFMAYLGKELRGSLDTLKEP